jgi:hypothetical protein
MPILFDILKHYQPKNRMDGYTQTESEAQTTVTTTAVEAAKAALADIASRLPLRDSARTTWRGEPCRWSIVGGVPRRAMMMAMEGMEMDEIVQSLVWMLDHHEIDLDVRYSEDTNPFRAPEGREEVFIAHASEYPYCDMSYPGSHMLALAIPEGGDDGGDGEASRTWVIDLAAGSFLTGGHIATVGSITYNVLNGTLEVVRTHSMDEVIGHIRDRQIVLLGDGITSWQIAHVAKLLNQGFTLSDQEKMRMALGWAIGREVDGDSWEGGEEDHFQDRILPFIDEWLPLAEEELVEPGSRVFHQLAIYRIDRAEREAWDAEREERGRLDREEEGRWEREERRVDRMMARELEQIAREEALEEEDERLMREAEERQMREDEEMEAMMEEDRRLDGSGW